jgi:hypothetical protein
MSETPVCPTCGHAVGSIDVLCPQCFTDLLRHVPPPPVDPARSAGSAPAAQENANDAIEPGTPPTIAEASWTCQSPACAGVAWPTTIDVCPYCQAPRRSPGAQVGALVLAGHEITIELAGPGPWTVGREAIGQEALQAFDTVSRRHARLARAGDDVHVRDLRSSNGTFVGDVPVPADRDVPLPIGGDLGLGRSVRLILGVKAS